LFEVNINISLGNSLLVDYLASAFLILKSSELVSRMSRYLKSVTWSRKDTSPILDIDWYSWSRYI